MLVTVPPFIQRAAKEQLLAEFQPQDSARIPGVHDRYSPLVNNYLTFIYNSKLLKTAPASWQDLLDSRFRNKLQYSTPGQAGDGTAVMLQAFHSMGGAKRRGSIISVSSRPITLVRLLPPVS